MLHEYIRLAKSIDNISHDQTKEIIGTVIDRLKSEIGAIIIDVWIIVPGRGYDILNNYYRLSEPYVPAPQAIALTPDQTGLLAWVAEKRKPIWLDDIPATAKSGVNRLSSDDDDKMIGGRYFNLYDETRAFAAVPIQYEGQFGILSAETRAAGAIKNYHIDIMKALTLPTGILIWKAGAFEAKQKHTSEAIKEFTAASGGLVSTTSPYRTGFIARPFEDRFDYVGRAIEKIFAEKRVRATSYHPAGGTGVVMSEMLIQINSAHFGIADITSMNLNVLFEIGAMIALDKPRIILRDRSDNIPLPFNLSGYDIHGYSINQNNILISDASKREIPLEVFVGDFISKLAVNPRGFGTAKEFP
jgi:hypothetical protein